MSWVHVRIYTKYFPMHIYYRRCVAFTMLRKVTMRYNIKVITSNLVTSKKLAGGRQQCVLHRKHAVQCLEGPRGFKIFCELSFFRAKPIKQKQQCGILSVCHISIRIYRYEYIDNIKNIDEALISPSKRDFC